MSRVFSVSNPELFEEERHNKNLDVEELAERADMSPTTVRKLLHGRPVRPRKIKELCEFLKLDYSIRLENGTATITRRTDAALSELVEVVFDDMNKDTPPEEAINNINALMHHLEIRKATIEDMETGSLHVKFRVTPEDAENLRDFAVGTRDGELVMPRVDWSSDDAPQGAEFAPLWDSVVEHFRQLLNQCARSDAVNKEKTRELEDVVMKNDSLQAELESRWHELESIRAELGSMKAEIESLQAEISWMVTNYWELVADYRDERRVVVNGRKRDTVVDSNVVSVEQFRDELLDAICGTTGYSIDMLEDDLELEAELGVDSIKLVQIVGGLAQRHSILPGLETFARFRTIRDIVNAYAEGLAEANAKAALATRQEA